MKQCQWDSLKIIRLGGVVPNSNLSLSQNYFWFPNQWQYCLQFLQKIPLILRKPENPGKFAWGTKYDFSPECPLNVSWRFKNVVGSSWSFPEYIINVTWIYSGCHLFDRFIQETLMLHSRHIQIKMLLLDYTYILFYLYLNKTK